MQHTRKHHPIQKIIGRHKTHRLRSGLLAITGIAAIASLIAKITRRDAHAQAASGIKTMKKGVNKISKLTVEHADELSPDMVETLRSFATDLDMKLEQSLEALRKDQGLAAAGAPSGGTHIGDNSRSSAPSGGTRTSSPIH